MRTIAALILLATVTHAAEIMRPVVLVDGCGSGTIMRSGHSQSYILTNRHVTKWTAAHTVKFYLYGDGGRRVTSTTWPAELVVDSKEQDLALLRIDIGGLPTVKVATTVPALLSEVWVVGCPMELDPYPTKGYVSDLDLWENGVDFIGTTANTYYGNSGGALFTAEGLWLGVPSRIRIGRWNQALPYFSLAIPYWRVKAWLSPYCLDYIMENANERVKS